MSLMCQFVSAAVTACLQFAPLAVEPPAGATHRAQRHSANLPEIEHAFPDESSDAVTFSMTPTSSRSSDVRR